MAQTEGRLALALQAYRQQHFPSYRAAAGSYDVSHTTLLRRDHRTTSRVDFISPNRKLTQTEELALIKWILDIDTRGIPPTKILV